MIPNTKAIKAIIFDIDGTLYSNLQMLLNAPMLYLTSLQWIFPYARMRKQLRKELQDKADSSQHYLNKRALELFSQEIKNTREVAQYILVNKIQKNWINGLKKTPLRPGMRKLIADLYLKKYKLGILSDFSAYEKLKNWNILHYFQCVISAEEYGTFKPDTKLFTQAAEQLNVRNEECLYIGNHVKYDGFGALNAGMSNAIFQDGILRKKREGIHFIRKVQDIYTYLGLIP